MKFQLMSDLHVNHPGSAGFPPLAPGIDAVVVAGDTCEGLVRAIGILRRAYPLPIKIIMVAGNHEMWSGKLSYEEHFEAGHAAADQHRVSLLENSVEFLGNTRVLGCTLWTDYEICGKDLRAAAMRSAGECMLDHRRIKWSREPWMRFRPAEARILHLRSRDFLERELEKPHPGPTIVVCHHAMTLDAVPPRHKLGILSAAYASEMLPMIDRLQPDLVVTGHTHHSIDFMRGMTRMISNPAGYAGENRSFDPTLVIEVNDD
jgi:predicted phosphodiesterase